MLLKLQLPVGHPKVMTMQIFAQIQKNQSSWGSLQLIPFLSSQLYHLAGETVSEAQH